MINKQLKKFMKSKKKLVRSYCKKHDYKFVCWVGAAMASSFLVESENKQYRIKLGEVIYYFLFEYNKK